MTRRRGRAAVAAFAIGGAIVGVPSAQAEGECRITGGHATVLVREVDEPTPVFEGSMFVVTRDCGDGPLTITGGFAPVAGTPASCYAQPSTFGTPYTNQNRASCSFTGSLGLGLSGTPVAVSAIAEVAGLVERTDRRDDEPRGPVPVGDPDPASDRVSGNCVLPMPETNMRSTCSLFGG